MWRTCQPNAGRVLSPNHQRGARCIAWRVRLLATSRLLSAKFMTSPVTAFRVKTNGAQILRAALLAGARLLVTARTPLRDIEGTESSTQAAADATGTSKPAIARIAAAARRDIRRVPGADRAPRPPEPTAQTGTT